MRHIEPEMIEFLDRKLASNGLAQHAVATKDARQVYLQANLACVGITEKSGRNDGPMVELIQETIGGHSNEAWCMALQQTCIAYAEYKTGIASPVFSDELCTSVWANTPKSQRVKYNPLPGATVIWQHGNGPTGHTGCVLGCDESIFQTVEGNVTSGQLQENGKTVWNKGGVFFEKARHRLGDGDMKVLGFLKPF